MFNLRTALFVACLFTAGSAVAQSSQTPPVTANIPLPAQMPVYDTALSPGWQNWSWAKADLSVELSGSARKPIRVTAGPWQALYLHHEPFNTAGLKKLS